MVLAIKRCDGDRSIVQKETVDDPISRRRLEIGHVFSGNPGMKVFCLIYAEDHVSALSI